MSSTSGEKGADFAVAKEITRLAAVLEREAQAGRYETRTRRWISALVVGISLLINALFLADKFYFEPIDKSYEQRAELRELLQQIAEIDIEIARVARDQEALDLLKSGTNSIRYASALRGAEILQDLSVPAPAAEYLFVASTLKDYSRFELALNIAEKALEESVGYVEVISTRNQIASLYYRAPSIRDLGKAREQFELSLEQTYQNGGASLYKNLESTLKGWIVEEFLFGECKEVQPLVDRAKGILEAASADKPEVWAGFQRWLISEFRGQQRCSRPI